MVDETSQYLLGSSVGAVPLPTGKRKTGFTLFCFEQTILDYGNLARTTQDGVILFGETVFCSTRAR